MTDTSPLIAICFPSGDTVHADFALSLAGLCHAVGPLRLTVINTKSSIVAVARNNGVARAQEAKADYLLFLDSDMVFPRETLIRLLKHMQDIVGATYSKRLPPYPILGTALSGQSLGEHPDLVEMERIPTGCLLIRMSVFDTLKKPYFRFEYNETNGNITGEDYTFCDRVREAGFRIWCDAALSKEIGHIGQQIHYLPKSA